MWLCVSYSMCENIFFSSVGMEFILWCFVFIVILMVRLGLEEWWIVFEIILCRFIGIFFGICVMWWNILENFWWYIKCFIFSVGNVVKCFCLVFWLLFNRLCIVVVYFFFVLLLLISICYLIFIWWVNLISGFSLDWVNLMILIFLVLKWCLYWCVSLLII